MDELCCYQSQLRLAPSIFIKNEARHSRWASKIFLSADPQEGYSEKRSFKEASIMLGLEEGKVGQPIHLTLRTLICCSSILFTACTVSVYTR